MSAYIADGLALNPEKGGGGSFVRVVVTDWHHALCCWVIFCSKGHTQTQSLWAETRRSNKWVCTMFQVRMGGDVARKQMRSGPRHVKDDDLFVLLWDSHVGLTIRTNFKIDIKKKNKTRMGLVNVEH